MSISNSLMNLKECGKGQPTIGRHQELTSWGEIQASFEKEGIQRCRNGLHSSALALSVHNCFLLLRNRSWGPHLTGSNSTREYAILVPAGSIVQKFHGHSTLLSWVKIKRYRLLSPVRNPGCGLKNKTKTKQKVYHCAHHATFPQLAFYSTRHKLATTLAAGKPWCEISVAPSGATYLWNTGYCNVCRSPWRWNPSSYCQLLNHVVGLYLVVDF